MIDWIEQGKEIQDKTASATPVNKRHEALTYCLERAIDLSTTVHFAAKAALVESTATVTRALYETFLWTSWIQLSEENAATYQEVAQNELMRQARRILKTGIGVVRNKQTGKDVTEQFLQITNGLKIPSRPRFDNMAKEAGLENVHQMFYTPQSIEAHGSAITIRRSAVGAGQAEVLFAHLTFANAMMKSIARITNNWVTSSQVTPASAIVQDIAQGDSGRQPPP